jgi:hypothetical protein
MKHDALLRRLRSTEMMVRGATTEGERVAAERARDRLVKRLIALRAADPVVLGVAAEFAAHRARASAQVDPIFVSMAEIPSVEEIFLVLRRWERGEHQALWVQDWAGRVVDKVLLPVFEPDDVRSIHIEVLLQLSSIRGQRLLAEDVPALAAFLQAPVDGARAAWDAWFSYVRTVDWHARRRRAS